MTSLIIKMKLAVLARKMVSDFLGSFEASGRG